MASFTFFKMGLVFWILSLILFFSGILLLSSFTIESVALILTAVTNFILGGLSIIYGEFIKGNKK